MKPRLSLRLAALTILFSTRATLSGTLWLGNDGAGDVFHTDDAGNVIHVVPTTPVTGVAFDGTNLYFSNHLGQIDRRSEDGTTIFGGFSISTLGNPSEDLAWDPTRQRLWRIEHDPASVRKIDPISGTVDATYSIPAVDEDPNLTPREGLGIAYDCRRDRLYISFCQAGCASVTRGLVLVMDPNTGAIADELFRTDGFATGGLGYDAASDALWVGDVGTIRKMSFLGVVLDGFVRPQPGGFVDGLEFIGSCEPTPAIRPTWGHVKTIYR